MIKYVDEISYFVKVTFVNESGKCSILYEQAFQYCPWEIEGKRPSRGLFRMPAVLKCFWMLVSTNDPLFFVTASTNQILGKMSQTSRNIFKEKRFLKSIQNSETRSIACQFGEIGAGTGTCRSVIVRNISYNVKEKRTGFKQVPST